MITPKTPNYSVMMNHLESFEITTCPGTWGLAVSDETSQKPVFPIKMNIKTTEFS